MRYSVDKEGCAKQSTWSQVLLNRAYGSVLLFGDNSGGLVGILQKMNVWWVMDATQLYVAPFRS